ncbi:spinster family MFS transporter [Altericroceibacterium endophyticum]|uniref:MFS transporter n=1 Tax=Altericroceibacterium endophyticum TaxID=1808508 RepID=A0A6I4TA95_9SPHN|nr:MFS transporter [Altericroceibacterium endophyticum]MXO66675.1 MFS transporter [Altericroceibacterium endophyticum]
MSGVSPAIGEDARSGWKYGAARSWFVVILLLLAYTISLIDRQVLSLLVVPIEQSLNISDTQISLLHGLAFAIFYTLFGIAIGRAVDRYNRRNIIICGMVLWCLATMACGLASSFAGLFVARMFVGVGEATLSPAAFSMIADYFPPEKRGRAISVFSMGVFAGSGLALIAGGMAIDAMDQWAGAPLPVLGKMESWQLAFFAVGAPGLLVAALIMTIREPKRREMSDDGLGFSETLAFFRRKAPALLTMILAFGANGLINFALAGWAPTFFIRVFGWSAGEIGAVYGTLLMVCGSAGIWVGGALSDWLVKRVGKGGVLMVMRGSALLMIPSLAAFGFASDSTYALIALGWSCFVLGLPTGLAPVALYAITPNQFRGQVTACYLFSVTLIGMMLGSTLIALGTDYLFQDVNAVGKSLALVASCAALFSFVSLSFSQRIQKRDNYA